MVPVVKAVPHRNVCVGCAQNSFELRSPENVTRLPHAYDTFCETPSKQNMKNEKNESYDALDTKDTGECIIQDAWYVLQVHGTSTMHGVPGYQVNFYRLHVASFHGNVRCIDTHTETPRLLAISLPVLCVVDLSAYLASMTSLFHSHVWVCNGCRVRRRTRPLILICACCRSRAEAFLK